MAYNVLVIDDSSTMRIAIRKTIMAAGFAVGDFFEASDGAAALELLKTKWVDVILCDINMPKMDGIMFLEEVGKNPLLKGVPVVIVSTEGSVERQEQVRALGAAGFVKKPFQPEDIRRVLIPFFGEPKGEVDNATDF